MQPLNMIPFCLLSLATYASAQTTKMTGNDVITNLDNLAQVYVDLTNLAASGKTAKVLRLYTNVTMTEQANENAPQPQSPFKEVVQYGIAAASHSLAIEDRRFLMTLSDHAADYSAKQKQTLVELIDAQLKIVHLFDKDDKTFGPDVLNIIKADDAFLDASLNAAAAAFSI